ncbi:hypothetical protein P171DRAFT_426648 [Karstenula rhodostoma CBS 690.94]|uniref:Uncharacterized protein n=1 Tax=Karstenula rhodostoma CBS 690.94 TaxID=1392251 RepID=A0A9P4UFN0_9PLEO|nr:hypothetical protein P171DRAFT_426648 [Karstenula rhodostoma CBS 690.94]
MKLLCFLLPLFVAAVSAIDIRFSGDTSCQRISVTCIDAEPNTCCKSNPGSGMDLFLPVYRAGDISCICASGYLPNNRSSNYISFGAVPGEWRITMRGHTGDNCDLAVVAGGDSSGANGLQDYCYFSSSAIISSGSYFFPSKNAEASTTSSTNCSLVNGIILEDGTKYLLGGLDENAIAEAV